MIQSRVASVLLFIVTTAAFNLTQLPRQAAAAEDVFFPGRLLSHDEILGDLPDGSGVLPKRFALVIGIDNYDNVYKDADSYYKSGLFSMGHLMHAASDANNFADAIASAGFAVTRLIARGSDQRITRNDIFHAIGDLADATTNSYKKTGRFPIVLFYFAGHGLFYSDGSQSSSGSNFVISSDFVPVLPKDIPEMGIKVDDIITRLRDVTPGLIVAIFDACRDNIAPKIGDKAVFHFGHEPANLSPSPLAELHFEDTKRLWLIQSTLDRQSAADDGKFTGALITALNAIKNTTAAKRSGLDSSLSVLNTLVRNIKMSPDGFKQDLTIELEAQEFDFFATEEDYTNELNSIRVAISPKVNIPGPDYPWSKRLGDERNIWCQLSAEREKDTPYSYFGSFVKSIVDRYNQQFARDKCATNLVGQYAGARDQVDQYTGAPKDSAELTPQVDSVVLTPKVANARVPSTTSRPVLLDSVVNKDYRDALGQLDLSQPLNSLAMSVLSDPVYETSAAMSPPLCTMVVYGLVQLLDVDNQKLKVRTAHGNCVGYVDKNAVIPGRSPISFSIPISKETQVEDVRVAIPNDFPSWMVTDGVVYFDETGARALGMGRAQANYLKAAILEQVARISPALARTLNIVVQRVSGDELSVYNVAPGTVKAVLVVIPITDEARRRLPARNFGTAINVANAVSLDPSSTPLKDFGFSAFASSARLGDFLDGEEAISKEAGPGLTIHRSIVVTADSHDLPTTGALPAGEEIRALNPPLERAPAVPLPPGLPRPAEACLVSANEQIARAGDGAGRFRGDKANVQLSTSNQDVTLSYYNALTPALRGAGFLVPASEEVPPRKAPKGAGEVRYCEVENNKDAAEFALRILIGCGLPVTFKLVPLTMATCRGKKVAGNIEIWFPQ